MNYRDDRSIVEGGDEGVGVERLVGDQSAGIDGFDERLSASQIVILARAEHHLDRIAKGVDERVNLVVSPPRDRPMACAPCFFGRRRYAGERGRRSVNHHVLVVVIAGQEPKLARKRRSWPTG